MKTFIIDQANHVRVRALKQAAHQGPQEAPFGTREEFEAVSESWPMTRFVEIWNNLPGVKRTRRFTDRSVARRRIWTAIQALLPETKSELVIRLLKRTSGATLKEIMTATGWQPHSVRGFISGQLSKRLRVQVISIKRQGERVYRIRKKAL